MLATADTPQKFQLTLDNYDILNLTLLSIRWSLIPNLTAPLNLTSNSTVLTVNPGQITQLTTYTLTVIVANIMYASASRT